MLAFKDKRRKKTTFDEAGLLADIEPTDWIAGVAATAALIVAVFLILTDIDQAFAAGQDSVNGIRTP